MPGGGAKPGERRGGRKKGTPNRTTATLRALAADHTDLALERLVRILKNDGAPAAAHISAAREVLDRAYGRPAQAITGPEGGPVEMKQIIHQQLPDDDDE